MDLQERRSANGHRFLDKHSLVVRWSAGRLAGCLVSSLVVRSGGRLVSDPYFASLVENASSWFPETGALEVEVSRQEGNGMTCLLCVLGSPVQCSACV